MSTSWLCEDEELVVSDRRSQNIETVNNLDHLEVLFRSGQISAVWAVLKPIFEGGWLAANSPPNREMYRATFLQLGCALYGVGNLAAAREINRTLDSSHWPLMRYRLALRLGDYSTARKLRRAHSDNAVFQADFACSLGLHLIWSGKYGLGFPLYTARTRAVNFTKIIPNNLRYIPIDTRMAPNSDYFALKISRDSEQTSEDRPFLILEQGVGDVLIHLGCLKVLVPDAAPHIIGASRYRGLVSRLFPNARFTALNSLGNAGIDGTSAHASADIMAWAHAQTGRFGPVPCDALELGGRGVDPRIGICWRGGSGQNRREERHIPLGLFLDMLPRDQRYVCLQHDLTKQEREFLLRDGRVDLPLADLTGDVFTVIEMVARLRGVLSVDSANLHFAGLAGTPVLAVMNSRAHWFWGPQACVGTVYERATTIPRADLTLQVVTTWLKGLAPIRSRGSAALAQVKSANDLSAERLSNHALTTGDTRAARPVFITGLPRSGTSMVTRVLAMNGLWLGDTVGATAENRFGFFENRRMRDVYVKGILRAAGADPAGVTSLPALEALPPYPGLRWQLQRVLRDQGYDGNGVWGFKDPKLSLVWPIFADAFPEAQWVIVRRPDVEVIDSLCRTSFMARHSNDPNYWRDFLRCYDHRLEALQSAMPERCHEIDTVSLRAGDLHGMQVLCESIGLGFEADSCAAAIAPDEMRVATSGVMPNTTRQTIGNITFSVKPTCAQTAQNGTNPSVQLTSKIIPPCMRPDQFF